MRSLGFSLLAVMFAAACSGQDQNGGSAPPSSSPGGNGATPSSPGGSLPPSPVTPPPTGGPAPGTGVTPPGGGGTTPEPVMPPSPVAPSPDAAAPAGGDKPGIPPVTGTGVTAGMTRLDDGMTLNGWAGSATLWSAKDGTLQGSGTTGGALLVTKDDYSDFRIIFQTRMTANNGKGHLGICFWGKRTMPAGGYGDCKLLIPPGGGSWDYAAGGGLPGTTHPMMGKFDVMQWHQIEVLCKMATGTCRMATDGVEVIDYKEPKPARLLKGPIGMQIHAGTSTVQYKEVFVDAAPADDTLRTVMAK
jgi:hypothetical protein